MDLDGGTDFHHALGVLALDDAGVADQLFQQKDAALDEALLILGIVVFGVFIDIAELFRLPDSLGDLGAALVTEHLELRLQAVQALLGDIDDLVVFHDSPFRNRPCGSVEPPYYTRFP